MGYRESLEKMLNREKEISRFLPNKPLNIDAKYTFPTSFSGLSLEELSDWVAQFAAWRGFCKHQLSLEQVRLKALKDEYSRILSTHSLNMKSNMGSQKLLKDEIEESCCQSDADAQELRELIEEETLLIMKLDGSVDVYDKQIDAIKLGIYAKRAWVQNV